MSANDRQVGGDHYRKRNANMQHWDFAAQQGYDYFQGAITKYVDRWKEKDGVIALEKAKHYLEKYIEEIKKGNIPSPVDGIGLNSVAPIKFAEDKTGQARPFGYISEDN